MARDNEHGGGGSIPTDPTGTIYLETQALYDTAYAWQWEVSLSLAAAQARAAEGEGQGYLFGVALQWLQEPHDAFVQDAADTLKTGVSEASKMGEAVQGAAKDFEKTDSERATLMTKTQAKLGG
jgi:hypothetical protein